MPGTYPTGWHTMILSGKGVSTIYPDPFERGTPFALVDFGVNEAAESVFVGGNKDAVIRAIHHPIDTEASTPRFLLEQHDGSGRYFLGKVSATSGIEMPDVNILIPNGFRLRVLAQFCYAAIYYEINAQG